MGVYLSLREDGSFHTLIIKKSVGEYTFLISLGYSGGGTFDEFYGKFKYTDQNVITGFYSNSLGSGEWEEKITSVKFDSTDQRFNVQKEDLFELMDTNDNKIQFELLEEINKYLYWGYDEETEEEYDDPILKDIDFNMFRKLPNSNQYKNVKWNDNLLELTNSDLWNLSFHFPVVPLPIKGSNTNSDSFDV